MIDRRLVASIDWLLVGATVLLTIVGILMVYSATEGARGRSGATRKGEEIGATKSGEVERAPSPRARKGRSQATKQLIGAGLGLVALLVTLGVDYRRLVDRAVLLYVAAVAVLAGALAFAPRIATTKRWFLIGGFQVQPSEFVKVAAALFLARIFAESRHESLGLREVAPAGIAIGGLFVLIAAAPDLGTAICLLPLFLAVAFLAGLRMKAVAGLVLSLAIVGGIGWTFFVRDYQKMRVYTFLNPRLDPRGAGYQKIQSEIAVGSGGFLGKGFMQGSQTQLEFLPVAHTDFVFSVLAEEMGFLGVAVVLGLYLFVLWRMLETAQLARDRVGAFLAAGIAAVFAFQVVYNVAMVAGLVPVKGLPLPLLSYGGSSIIASFISIGLILNVRMRRFAN